MMNADTKSFEEMVTDARQEFIDNALVLVDVFGLEATSNSFQKAVRDDYRKQTIYQNGFPRTHIFEMEYSAYYVALYRLVKEFDRGENPLAN